MMLLIKSTTVAGHFFRCGRKFTDEGVVVDMEEFTEKQLEQLRDEVNLKIREATPAEIKAAKVKADVDGNALLDDIAEADLFSAIRDVMSDLPAEAFKNGGAPTLKAIRAAFDGNPKDVTEARRDHVWEQLKQDGFRPPEEPKG